MGAKYFGAAVRRREDPRFLRGDGRFIDDVVLPGLLHAAFLRSPHAHARLLRVSTEGARAISEAACTLAQTSAIWLRSRWIAARVWPSPAVRVARIDPGPPLMVICTKVCASGISAWASSRKSKSWV